MPKQTPKPPIKKIATFLDDNEEEDEDFIPIKK
jgi:hypothetical protein